MQGPHFPLFTSLVLLPFFLSHVSTASRLPSPPVQKIVGSYQPIKNINDLQIVEIAKFAVEEYNKSQKAHPLAFIKVVEGEFQVVAGTNYKLVIEAKISTDIYQYLAIVFEDLKGNKELEEFLPAN